MATNYSGSKCPKCEKTSFEMVDDAPAKSKYKFMYIRCSNCKTIIGVTEFFNSGQLLSLICEKLGIKI